MSHGKIRIGVLGCAKIASRSVIPAIQELSNDFELMAVASRDEAKANEFAHKFNCEAIVGYEELVARNDIDAIYVPLPTGLHYEWVGKAIDAGKHVYAEKSFVSTEAQASKLVLSAEKRNIGLMEGYMFLYHKQQALVSSILQGGELGEIRHFHGCFGFPPLPADDFRYSEELGGGALMDAAGYPLRAAFHFCGESLAVNGASIFRDPKSRASLWGGAYLSRNSELSASIAFGFDNFYQCRYEIWGSKAKITAERAFTPGPTFSPRIIIENKNGSHVINVEPDNHFVGALIEFRNLIENENRKLDHYRHILNQIKALEKIRALAVN